MRRTSCHLQPCYDHVGDDKAGWRLVRILCKGFVFLSVALALADQLL
jgi:hypothetical protein